MLGNHSNINSKATINYDEKLLSFRIDSKKREVDRNMPCEDWIRVNKEYLALPQLYTFTSKSNKEQCKKGTKGKVGK